MVEGKINWKRLYEAIEFYDKNGYKYIDLDWCVSTEASDITKPSGIQAFFIEDKELVASGEQSFLDMMLNNNLPKGKYCGITPCFRDEKNMDYIHQKYFMKVELIDTIDCNQQGLDNIINIAKRFYQQYLDVDILKIDDFMYDIIDSKNKIELGSYGCRANEEYSIKWVYGTGLAEPRLSKVLLKNNSKVLLKNNAKYLELDEKYRNWVKNNAASGYQSGSPANMYDYLDKPENKLLYRCIEEDMYIDYRKDGGVKMIIKDDLYYGLGVMDFEILLSILEERKIKNKEMNISLYKFFANILEITDMNGKYIGKFDKNKFILVK